jgi:hypothetical protein
MHLRLEGRPDFAVAQGRGKLRRQLLWIGRGRHHLPPDLIRFADGPAPDARRDRRNAPSSPSVFS